MTAMQDDTLATWRKLPLKYGLRNNLVTAHALARSAIFSTQSYRCHAQRPLYLEKTPLTSTSDIKVFQTAGHQLDQGDADVFYELLRRVFASECEMQRESRVCFNRAELLKALGRSSGGKTRKLLDESLDRLFRAEFEFSVPGLFTGKSRLILKMHRRDKESTAVFDFDVLLDVELAKLFDRKQWALLRQSQRQLLEGNPLARGLHAFYSTLVSPYPMYPETLKQLMGRQTMQESKWRAALLTALDKLKRATGWTRCELETEGKNAGKVVVVRDNTSAQVRASVRKAETSAPDETGAVAACDDI
ncbi:plasmid replication initiator TrfA [Paraburkholderia caledonica]|uniref:plasmid replication initiator TrfA n=1 Tax=Paraburkholderia caledonica TaxID=134536 RepID=UPI000B48F13B|nr:hypothetical protein BWU74_25490 [Burkholderia sp. Bk]